MGAPDIHITDIAAQTGLQNLADPFWRITSGELYKIVVKDDDEDDDSEGVVVPFKPNRAQRRFLKRMWHRNIILKARQLGFTTLIVILWLDHALFNANVSCGIVAHNLKAAGKIFRDKLLFAYNNLPPALKAAFPLRLCNSEEMVFDHNGSSIMVATSLRSGTYHRVHVSEYGKICAKFPDKAQEIKTGTLPSCPKSGIIIIESTAEGTSGDFYKKTQIAMRNHELSVPLTQRDYRFHFFPWWGNPEYAIDPEGVVISEKDHEYFDGVEQKMECVLTMAQRAWYVKTRETDFSGEDEDMWQEYPSTPPEAFQVSTEGNYYAKQMTKIRKEGRILRIPKIIIPVNTFWDVGNSDGCAIWFHQPVGMEHRFIKYHENSGEDLRYYAKYLQDTGYIFDTHYLPHDADHKRLSDQNKSIADMLRELLPGQRFEIVPKVDDITVGIQQTRAAMDVVYFDEEGCKEGIQRLDNYKKKWNERQGRWSDTPLHDENSEGADAFRMFGQAYALGMIRKRSTAPRRRRPANWRTA